MVNRTIFKDFLREIRNTKSRFISIFLMIALGVAFFAGLKTAGPDMEDTADKYFDEQRLMDVQVLSTLGLTDEDVTALSAVDGVETAEGMYTLDAVIVSAESDTVVKAHSLSENGLNEPSVLEGRLPETADECVVEAAILEKLDLNIGDRITLDAAAGNYADALAVTDFEIVGTVKSPYYISKERGTSSIGSGSVSGFVAISPAAIDLDYYTEINITVTGAAELNTFSDAYETLIDDVIARLESEGDVRVQIRYEDIISDAEAELADARQALADGEAEANEKLVDARRELDDGWVQLADGEAELADGWDAYYTGIAEGEAQLSDAYDLLVSGEAAYADGLAQTESGEAELAVGRSELAAQETAAKQGFDAAEAALIAAENTIADQQAQLDALRQAVDGLAQQIADLTAAGGDPTQIAALQAQYDTYNAQYQTGAQQLTEAKPLVEGQRAEFDAQKAEVLGQIAAGWDELNAAQAELTAARQTLASSRTELDSGWASYNSGLSELESQKASGRQALEDGETELVSARQELEDGEAAYLEGKDETERELQEGRDAIADAEDEIAKLKNGTVYVRDRGAATPSFSGYAMDAERISNLADVLPIIFFLVAALVSLTTMTRMVESKRTQMGSVLALGYSKTAVASEYIIYGALASLAGSLVGYAIGCVLIPLIIINAYSIMYTIGAAVIAFRPGYMLLSVGISLACVLAATLIACVSAFSETPASLMRPKAPKPGKRVFLERVTPLWRRMSFIYKVTVRNLFRYKKRLLMTIIGIGGCTALIIVGFGIRDSIRDVTGIQFSEISTYNLMGYLSDSATDSDRDAVRDYLDDNDRDATGTMAYLSSSTLSSPSRSVAGYCVVPEDSETLKSFIHLRDRKTGDPVELEEGGVVITEKLSELLGLSVGDEITLDTGTITTLPITGICENYVYHYVYILPETYEAATGETPTENIVYVDAADDSVNETAEDLLSMDAMAAISNIQETANSVSQSMESVDAAVVVVVVSAAMLAFVVLYNLNNINITERMRELSTIKVLGFYDIEVSAYVLRENIVLTVIGITLGQFLGVLLHKYLIKTVEIDMVMFGRNVAGLSFLYSILLTILFAVIVNVGMHRKLKKIDMVESLKMPE